LKTDFLIFAFLCVWVGSSCELEKTIEVPLPAVEKQLVAEAYAERGKPLRFLLMETDAYFDSLRLPFLSNALIILKTPGQPDDTLKEDPVLDTKAFKFYNYLSGKILTEEDLGYQISISHKGRELTGSTAFLPPPELDSVEIQYNSAADSSVRFLFWVRDFAGQSNYYRIMLNEDSLTGNNVLEFTFTDSNLDGQLFPVGTSYRFDKNKKYILRLFHLEQAYYQYLRSISSASRANGNPFAQPSTIQSPLMGNGYGIFTSLNYLQKTLKP
jgi:hypothetical protein